MVFIFEIQIKIFNSFLFLAELELGPGHTSSVEECLECAQILQDYGVRFFVFLAHTEECQLFADDLEKICSAIGGPASAPDTCYPV